MRIAMRRHQALGLSTALALTLLSPIVYSKAKDLFSNMDATVTCPASEILSVSSTADVQAAVRDAKAKGLSIKAAVKGWQGSNHNSCVGQGGLQIDTTGLNRILQVDPERMQVTVQPGMKLWDFNQKTHKDWGLILSAVQEYAEPTLGGMLGNGTHGSSLSEPSSSIQDYLISATVVNGLGEVQTFQGEELDFYATNLGVLGILTEITLQLQPSFKVQARISSHDEGNLANDILDLAQAHYSTNVTWFPGQKKYTVTALDKVPNETPGTAHNGQTEASWWKRVLMPLVFKASHVGPSRATMCFVEKQRYEMKAKSYFGEDYGKPIESAVGWAHEMLNFVCRDRCPVDQLPYALEEIAIDLKDLPQFITQAQELFHKTGACMPLNGIYFRFGHASRGALGMAGGRETVYVGMEYVRNPWGNRYPRDFEVIQELEQLLLNEYAGRPHWGKNQHPMFAGVSSKYPRFAEFEAWREQQDPAGIFMNDFYSRINGRVAPDAPAKNCVVDQACYCQVDEHCPQGYRCEQGLVYTEARVCRR
jgi:FAD/FMN-containing dehydrogenase